MKIDMPNFEDVSDERYFVIRDCRSDGCGSYYHFVVTRDTTTDEIMQIAADIQTSEMNKKEENYYPAFYNSQPVWRNTVKVVEQKRTITKTGDTGKTCNSWSTLRGGLKFTIVKSFAKIKTNLRILEHRSYSPGRLLL